MEKDNSAYIRLTSQIVQWAAQHSDIRLVLLIGSRARKDHPGDKWADLDIMIFSTCIARYLNNADWMKEIANVWARGRHRTVGNDAEWLATFEGGLDVDFVFSAYKRVQWQAMFMLATRSSWVRRLLPRQVAEYLRLGAQTMGRGTQVLVDKDRISSSMLRFMGSFSSTRQPPIHEAFEELAEYFWCMAEKTTKKIRRGELHVAASWCNYLQNTAVLPMIEWHALSSHDWNYNTWQEGRFLEEWADPRVLDGLARSFPHYDRDDIGGALIAMMDLFVWLADETARQMHFACSKRAEEAIFPYVRMLLGRPTA